MKSRGAPRGAKSRGAAERTPPPPALDRTPFLATVMRHELYGSLNAITMIAGLLGERARKGQIDAEELSRLAARLLKQIERSTAIVDHYVELIGPPDSDDLDQGATCGAAEIRRALATTDGALRLDLKTLPADAELAMDANRLRYALRKVLDFAASKVPRGQPVTVSAIGDDEDFVTLDIRYPGEALAVDDLHVFERGPRNVEAGLVDLAVARRVVTDAGGEVAPRAGQIIVRLPRVMD